MSKNQFVYPTKLRECPICGGKNIYPKVSSMAYLGVRWDTNYECKSCKNKLG